VLLENCVLVLLSTMVIAMPEVVNEGGEGFFAHKDFGSLFWLWRFCGHKFPAE